MLWREVGFALTEPMTPNHEERLRSFHEGFNHWLEKARRFYAIHQSTKATDRLPEASFHLHQPTETAYKTVLLTLTGSYQRILSDAARSDVEVMEARLANAFPHATDFQNDAFTLHDYAYINIRYDLQCHIDEPTLSYLADRVANLFELAESACAG